MLPLFTPLPPAFPSKLPDVIPFARLHTVLVQSTDNGSVVASAGEDGKCMVWMAESALFNGWGLEHWEPLDFDPALSPASTSPRAASATSSRFHSTASNVLATSTGDNVVQAIGPRLPRSPQGAVRRTWRCHPKPGVQPFWYVPRESRRLAVTARSASGSNPVRIRDGHGGTRRRGFYTGRTLGDWLRSVTSR